MAPRARPNPCETNTLKSMMDNVSENVRNDGLRPPIQYVMVTKIVGRISSIGKSPAIRAK